MSTFTSAKSDEGRVARLAAIRARRAGITYESLIVTVGEIQVGDFVDVVHGAANLRGMTFGTAITSVRRDHATYRLGKQPIEATWLSTGHGAVAFPSSFRADIRRPVLTAV